MRESVFLARHNVRNSRQLLHMTAALPLFMLACGSSPPPSGGAKYVTADWTSEPPRSGGAIVNLGVTQGSLLFVAILGNGTFDTASVSDDHQNDYVEITGGSSGGTVAGKYFFAINRAFDTINLALMWPPTLTNVVVLTAEYTGISAAAPLDTAATSFGNGSAIDCGAIATTNANDSILLLAFGAPGTFSGASGYLTEPFPLNPNSTRPVTLQLQVVHSTDRYSVSLTDSVSGPWLCLMAAFRNQ